MFECISNCGKCCGCVPIQREIINKNRVYLQRRYRKVELDDGFIYPITADGWCIFLHKQTFKCQIYDERPKICILFGIIPELQCDYVAANGCVRTENEVQTTKIEKNRTVNDCLQKWLSMDK